MSDRAAKDALFDAFAEVAKALASGRRAEIVDVLAQGERSVEQLADEIGQSVANTSHHLRAMARAGVLRTRREGTRIVYMLASDRVGDVVGGDARHRRRTRRRHHRTRRRLPRRPRRAGTGDPTRARSPAARPATPSCSTCAPQPSSRPATSPAPGRSRSASCAGFGRCPRTSRSSPTAAGRTACTPTRPCANSAGAGSTPAVSKTDSPNGNEPACPIAAGTGG